LRFGPFEANLDTGELSKHGVRLKLHDQPFQVLAMLAARPGELVSRVEIGRTLWPAGTFVDFENGLNSAVNRLRDALGDCHENPKFIETVPRHGYRFIAQVSRMAGKTSRANAGHKKEESDPLAKVLSTRWWFQLALTSGFLAAFALIPGSAVPDFTEHFGNPATDQTGRRRVRRERLRNR
jgi:DNA-binding winged helix-turn-helix (wHTH) protein